MNLGFGRGAFASVALLLTACVDYGFDPLLLPERVSNPVELDDPVKTDTITQLTTPTVDVLWVIDNSCSMSCVVGCHANISEVVAANFPAFMDYFIGSGLDYHIGVITTDTDDPAHNGKLVYGLGNKFIDLETGDPNGTFMEMAILGTEGSGKERGLEASYVAIEELGESYNDGMFRDAGAQHTIVLSNEDNSETAKISKAEYIDWYDKLKEDVDDRTFDSIVCMASSVGDMCSSGLTSTGQAYLDVTSEIGGIKWDITNEDWAKLLDLLGAQAAGLRREYFLSQIPVPGTLEVSVEEAGGALLTFVEDEDGCDTELVFGDWAYSEARNSITFCEYVPGPLSTIIMTYTVASSVVEGGAEAPTSGGEGS
jgi:hypothetical protein